MVIRPEFETGCFLPPPASDFLMEDQLLGGSITAFRHTWGGGQLRKGTEGVLIKLLWTSMHIKWSGRKQEGPPSEGLCREVKPVRTLWKSHPRPLGGRS